MSIFNRLVNMAKAEFNHLADGDRKVSEEFSKFFKEKLNSEDYKEFFSSKNSQEDEQNSNYQNSYSYSQSSHQTNYSENQGYNPYKALEVSPDATKDEIEKAYRKMARKYHPDRFQTESERNEATRVMAIINASYEFLKKQY